MVFLENLWNIEFSDTLDISNLLIWSLISEIARDGFRLEWLMFHEKDDLSLLLENLAT